MKNSQYKSIYSLFSRTYKNRKMFSFMDFGEISLLPKGRTIRQTSNVTTRKGKSNNKNDRNNHINRACLVRLVHFNTMKVR